MMGEVHGGPPDPHRISDEDGPQSREDVTHEQGLGGSASSVQGRKGTKDDGRSSEAGGVEVGAQESIDAS